MQMALTEKNGFFPDYYLNLKNSQLENFDKQIEKITECQNDFERMVFVEQLACVRDADQNLLVRRSFDGKCAETAATFKEKGNQAFKEKKWLEAMVLYSKSYLSLPKDKVNEKAIILANRSATLYHMEKYNETLIDIKRSLDLGYPKDLAYKLYDRQARCYMAKKDYPNSISSFKIYQLTSHVSAVMRPIEVPATCNEFMIKCVACGECTNIFKGLKVMQDTEMMTRTAKRMYDANDYSKALSKFIDLLKIMYEVLAPPFADFCQCQQHLRDCFLHFGNFYNLD